MTESELEMLLVAHSLRVGGAERQFVNLAIGLHNRGHRIAVATLQRGGALEQELDAAGVPRWELQENSRPRSLMPFLRLLRRIRAQKPRVIYSFLPIVNAPIALMSVFVRGARVIWGVRASVVDFRRYNMPWRVKLVYTLERWLSFMPNLIVCNSNAGRRHVIGLGYPATRTHVIPNGIETARFKPQPAGRERVRGEWGICPEEKLIGIVGRFDPMKDHPTFLKAAALVANEIQDVRFVCVGDGPIAIREEVMRVAESLALGDKVLWPGVRADMVDVYNALDVLCMTSTSEGFPNVIGEAMACGTQCIATDVGDASDIVGDLGIVVPPSDPDGLAKAIAATISRAENFDHVGNRARIVENFSLVSLCERTEMIVMAEDPGCKIQDKPE